MIFQGKINKKSKNWFNKFYVKLKIITFTNKFKN